MRWGILASITVMLCAVTPNGQNAVAQGSIEQGSSNSASSSGGTEKSLSALVFSPATRSTAPDDALVNIVAYDAKKTPAVELVRATLTVQAGQIAVPLVCVACTVHLQAPYPFIIAFTKNSLAFKSLGSELLVKEFVFNGRPYTYAKMQAEDKDAQMMVLRIGKEQAEIIEAYPTSFASFAAAYKEAIGSLPSNFVAEPLAAMTDLLSGSADNSDRQAGKNREGRAEQEGQSKDTDANSGSESRLSGSNCPCDGVSPAGSKADDCCK